MVCLRGRGTRGRSRSMSSKGVNRTAAVPSENGRLKRSMTRPSASWESRPVAMGGRARYRARCSSPPQSLAAMRTAACRLNPSTTTQRRPVRSARLGEIPDPMRAGRAPRRGSSRSRSSSCVDWRDWVRKRREQRLRLSRACLGDLVGRGVTFIRNRSDIRSEMAACPRHVGRWPRSVKVDRATGHPELREAVDHQRWRSRGSVTGRNGSCWRGPKSESEVETIGPSSSFQTGWWEKW